jgi:hypothetical protein
MTKFTGTEVRGESQITSHRKETTPGNSDREAGNIPPSDLLSSLAQIPLVTMGMYWWLKNKAEVFELLTRFFCA